MKLTHVRLLVGDFSKSFRFYRDELGLPTEWEDNVSYAEFDLGAELDVPGHLGPREDGEPHLGAEMAGDVELRAAGDGVLLVLDVGDVDEVYARLTERGVWFEDEPHDRPEWGLRIVHVRDPDGYLLELFHDIEWVES